MWDYEIVSEGVVVIGMYRNLQLSGRQISRIASGAPFTYISPLLSPNWRTITLARLSWDTNSKDLRTPSSNEF